MAVFRNPNVSVVVRFQGVRGAIRKSGGHIPNFVAGVDYVLLMFYLFENKSVICLVDVPFLESKLLAPSTGSLNGSV
jgi:hypothetical protein